MHRGERSMVEGERGKSKANGLGRARPRHHRGGWYGVWGWSNAKDHGQGWWGEKTPNKTSGRVAFLGPVRVVHQACWGPEIPCEILRGVFFFFSRRRRWSNSFAKMSLSKHIASFSGLRGNNTWQWRHIDCVLIIIISAASNTKRCNMQEF